MVKPEERVSYMKEAALRVETVRESVAARILGMMNEVKVTITSEPVAAAVVKAPEMYIKVVSVLE